MSKKIDHKFLPICLGIIVLILISGFFYTRFLEKGNTYNTKPQVFTTFTVLADMVRNVAGEYAAVESLTKIGAEIHGYEPTPQDIVRLSRADIIFDNGMNLEKWAEKLYANVPDVVHVTISSGVTPISISEGPYMDNPNPHAWMSPSNALIYVDNIADALSEFDPDNSAEYKENAENYKEQIKQVDARLKKDLSELPPENRYLASCEGAFSYLIHDYNLSELYLWPINADAQGTPQQVRRVVDTVRENRIPAVFCENTVNDKAQRQVAKETGAAFGGVFYVDSLSGEDGPAPTYIKLLEYNAQTLIKGLLKGGGDAASN